MNVVQIYQLRLSKVYKDTYPAMNPLTNALYPSFFFLKYLIKHRVPRMTPVIDAKNAGKRRFSNFKNNDFND